MSIYSRFGGCQYLMYASAPAVVTVIGLERPIIINRDFETPLAKLVTPVNHNRQFSIN
jgi:hypothetical protein